MKQFQCLWTASVPNFTNSLILKLKSNTKRALKINLNTDVKASLLKNLKIMTWTFFVKSSFLGLLLKEYPSYLTTAAAAAAKSLQLYLTLAVRWQSTRLPDPWDPPGKNTGVDCHFFLQCLKVKSESEVAQSCPTLSDPRECSLPGSSIHGIFQARALEWGAIAFSDLTTESIKIPRKMGDMWL